MPKVEKHTLRAGSQFAKCKTVPEHPSGQIISFVSKRCNWSRRSKFLVICRIALVDFLMVC